MAINDEELELPRPFGPYTLLRRLAVGGMAEVYVAKAKGIGGFEKLVAIKVIHPRYSEDDHFIQMLVEEAKISVLLTHVNIAQTFDLGCIDDTYYIVMEFIEGADTYRVIRRAAEMKKAIPVDLAAYLVAEMCNGLDYAHRKRDAQGRSLGIVHRDISPQNVLVSYAGEVKIVDFGIAKAALRGGQTEAGVIKGKYYYMSPEQAWGDPMDHRSDIFSTGVVLYELLTGRMLYQEDNVPLLLDKVRKAEITPPTARRGSVPHALSEIVMRALRKEPIDRYQSAAEMGQALMQFVYAQSPTFSASRLAELMSTLFPNEAQRHSALIKLPSLEVSLDRPISESAGPPSIASDVLPVMKPEEFALPREASVIFELGEDDDEEDATRNDVLPFRRAAARAAAQQASASPGEAPGRPTLRPQRARETVQIRDEGRVSAPAVRADGTWAAPASSGPEAQVAPAIEAITTSPQRSAEEPTTSNESSPADDWEDETLLRGHGRASEQEQDFEGDSTLVDSGEVMKQMQAALAQADSMRGRTVESGRGRVHVKQPGASRPAVAAVPAPAPAASAKPRSVPPPARLPPRPASAPPPPMARAIPGPATSPGGVAAPVSRPLPPPAAIPARPAEAAPPVRADAGWPAAPPAPAPREAPRPTSFDPFGSVPPPAPGARPLMDPFGGPPVQPSVPPPVSPSFPPAPRPDPFAPPPQQTTGMRPIAEDLGKPSLARLALPIAGLVVLAVFAALVVALLSPGPPPPEIELITSPPGAQVALDGARISGVTPLTVRDGLVPGQTHRLEVSLPGYGGWAASIQATSGTLRQFIVLSPLPAALRVESEPPGAAITVNGVPRGNAPVQVDTGLFVGQEAEIRASLPGHLPFVQRVSLGEGVTSARAVLVPAAQ